MSMASPYSASTAPYSPRRSRAMRVTLREIESNPPLETVLLPEDEDRALALFRAGAGDTKDIAWQLEATEAAVSNGMARARDRERAA